MRHLNRKTTPKVRGGKVQRKNRHRPTPNVWNSSGDTLLVYKERPEPGFKHYVRQKHVLEFIEIVPEWQKLASDLRAVVLARDTDCDGWHSAGFVALCAWPREPWIDAPRRWYGAHRALLRRLGVPSEPTDDGVTCKFTPETVRAYMLLHVFLHELGHHHDRITTKRRRRASRGEGYAEEWAYRYEALVWDAYRDRFGW